MNNEIRFLKYLDDAVEYEKGKHKAISNICPPFSIVKIINTILNYDNQIFQSAHDCIEHMIANKALKNIVLRRNFELMIRENFDQIDFSALSQIPKFNEIKRRILNNDPELMHVDNGAFLRQIANAIAHGNYVKLLDIDGIKNTWKSVDTQDTLFKSLKNVDTTLYFQTMYGDKNQSYNEQINLLIDKLNEKASRVQATPLETYQNILQSNISPSEFVEIRYESNYTIDPNGNRVQRPCPQIYNLKASFKDIDEILFFIISSLPQEKRVVPIAKSGIAIKPLKANNSPKQDALKMLQVYDMALYNYQDDTYNIVDLDEHQKKFFVNDYVETREMFPKDFYKKAKISNYLADALSTNVGTQYFQLSNLFHGAKSDKSNATLFALSNNIKSYFDFTNTVLSNPESSSVEDFIDDNHKKTYYFKQIFNVYSESLISETLLLLQILEDNQQLSSLQNNGVINSVINKFSAKDLKQMQTTSKYNDDSISVVHHLRNSFTHSTYLNNPNGDLYIYDQVSKRDKTQTYKFTIHIKSLEKIKNELLSKVNDLYSSQSQNHTR